MLRNRRLNRRGISPVIATIIIVAIAIAVAFWVVGIAGLFTRFEKLEISYIYAEKIDTDQWTITLMVRNTGSATATIDQVFLNGIPNAGAASALTGPLTPRATISASFSVESNGFNSGMTVEVKLHTASGQEYYKAVVLP